MTDLKTNSPDRQIENIPIGQIKLNSKQLRIHSPKQIEMLRRGIQKFGFIGVVLVDDADTLLCGYARIEAARDLGMASIPAIRVTHLTETEKLAFTIADSRLSELSSWNEVALKQELRFLAEFDIDFDFSAIGFETAEIDILLEEGEAEQAEIDDVLNAAAEQPPVSKPGDLWQLDHHTVLCGDALEASSYEAVLAGHQAQMVFTDPPYNVPVVGHVLTAPANKHREFAMASGEMTPEAFTAFLTNIFTHLAHYAINGAIIFACMDWRHILEIATAGKLFTLKNLCVWVKNNGGMGSLYRSQHELVFVFKNGTETHVNNVQLGKHGRNRTNVWNYQGINSFGRHRDELLKLHPTVKPIALVCDAIKDCSKRGDLVLDPFGGSGTVLLAAEKTKRRAALIEIDPIYVDVIIRRWQKQTGKSAICAADGLSFAERETKAQSATPHSSKVDCVNADNAEEPHT